MLISELCGNHNGNEELLREMVEQSAKAGAHFAKIQTFFAKDLSDSYLWDADRPRLKKLELDWKQHALFVKYCNLYGITPMTSVYTAKYLPQLGELGFQYIKIGSAQCTEKEMIQTAIALGFKVIMSTGGHKLTDIPHFGPLTGVLHCVSKYPAKASEADLLRMLQIPKYWPNHAYGFSDHTDPKAPDWDKASKLAMFMGATYIERHFTVLARNETKDGPVSINFDQLKELCRYDRLSFEEKLAENPELGVLSCPKDHQEIEVIRHYKGRWDVKAS